MGRARWLAGAVALALIAAACGDDSAGPTTGPGGDEMAAGQTERVRSDLGREEPGTVSTDAVVDADTALALDLYRELIATDPDANLFLSPYSIGLALSMSLPGARGTTAEEIASVLGATDDESWHRGRNALDRALMAERPTVDELQPLELSIANSLWGQAGYPFEDDYLDVLARHYGAGLDTVDFTTDAEAARQAINDWVEDETNERIVDLVPDGAVDELTRMVLVNAIFFKANWLHQFDPELTTDEPFTIPDGTEVSVPTMHQSVRTNYGEGDGWQAVQLPYAGGASMLVIAPTAGRFASVAESLDAARLEEVRSTISDHMVDLSMPRFEMRSTLSLPDVLRGLGMVEAFVEPGPDGGADFTGITADRELFVTDVVHQAWVSVDEEGTEAAAATAMLFGVTSAPPPAELALDRPFVVVIQDDATGSILFIGQVTDPTAG